MGAAFLKHIQQVNAHATAVKLLKDSLPKAHKEKFHYYEKFRFEHDEKTLPLLVLGDLSKEFLEILKLANSGAAAEGICRVVDKKNVYFVHVGGRMTQTQLETVVRPTNFAGEVFVGKPPKPESKKEEDEDEDGEKEREDEGKGKEKEREKGERDDAKGRSAGGTRPYGRPPGGPNAGPDRIKDEDRTKEGHALPSKPLGEEYRGEDTKTGWRAAQIKDADPDSDKHTTKYFKKGSKEREDNKVRVDDAGMLRHPSGETMEGRKAFAMDPKTGEMHAKALNKPRTLPGGGKQYEHHSSFLAGEDAAAAGQIRTDDGFLSELDDDSGHYKPDSGLTRAAVEHLRDQQNVKMIDDRLEMAAGGRPIEGNEQEEVEAALAARKAEADALAKQRAELFQAESKRMEAEIREGAKKDPRILVVADRLDKIDAALAKATKESDVEEVKRWTEERRKLLVAKSSGISEEGKKKAKELADGILALRVASDQEAAPANRETKIAMQGKMGVSQAEYDEAGGSREKLDAIIEEKTGLKNFTAGIKESTINSRASLNKKIGEKLKLKVPASEFLAAEGDETSLRDRHGAMDAIKRMGGIDPKQEGGRLEKLKQAEADLARMNAEGFAAELKAFGIDLGPEGMPVEKQLQVFRGKVGKEAARRKWPAPAFVRSHFTRVGEGLLDEGAPWEAMLQVFRGEVELEEALRRWPSKAALEATKEALKAEGYAVEGPFGMGNDGVKRFQRKELHLDQIAKLWPRKADVDRICMELEERGVLLGRGGMPDSEVLKVFRGDLSPEEALKRWPQRPVSEDEVEEEKESKRKGKEKEAPSPRGGGRGGPTESDDDEDEKKGGGGYEVLDQEAPSPRGGPAESDGDEGEKEKEGEEEAMDRRASPRRGEDRGVQEESDEEEAGNNYEVVDDPLTK